MFCLSCTISYHCDICYSGYVRDYFGQCLPCAPYCHSCIRAGARDCDRGQCYAGMTNVFGGCADCTPHCSSCDRVGAGDCDPNYCNYGYTNFGRTCAPCGANCHECDVAGAGACDVCNSGYMVDQAKQCEPCPDNCAQCHERDSCDECNWFYTL